jgi:hypothetical protein
MTSQDFRNSAALQLSATAPRVPALTVFVGLE